MINENKFSFYLAYAFGEIVLVVFGILIAIQVDDWDGEKELNQEELRNYQLIIADLKRDSTLFIAYQKAYHTYLDTYFQMNGIKKQQSSFTNVIPDHLVSNIQFHAVTKNNHQVTIEKLRNSKIKKNL